MGSMPGGLRASAPTTPAVDPIMEAVRCRADSERPPLRRLRWIRSWRRCDAGRTPSVRPYNARGGSDHVDGFDAGRTPSVRPYDACGGSDHGGGAMPGGLRASAPTTPAVDPIMEAVRCRADSERPLLQRPRRIRSCRWVRCRADSERPPLRRLRWIRSWRRCDAGRTPSVRPYDARGGSDHGGGAMPGGLRASAPTTPAADPIM